MSWDFLFKKRFFDVSRDLYLLYFIFKTTFGRAVIPVVAVKIIFPPDIYLDIFGRIVFATTIFQFTTFYTETIIIIVLYLYTY